MGQDSSSTKSHLLSDITYEGAKISELYYACNELYHAGEEHEQTGIAMMAINMLDNKIEDHLANLYILLNGYFGEWETFKHTRDKLKNDVRDTEPNSLQSEEPLETSPSLAVLEASVNIAESIELSKEK